MTIYNCEEHFLIHAYGIWWCENCPERRTNDGTSILPVPPQRHPDTQLELLKT